MKFSKAFCFISLFLIYLFAGCKRYEDDQKRYLFRSPIYRLSHQGSGNPCWQIWEYKINGNDSTSLVGGHHGTEFCVTDKHKTSVDFDGNCGKGRMELTSNKNILNISFTTIYAGKYNPFIYTSTDWEIVELDIKLMRLKGSMNGNIYEILFTD